MLLLKLLVITILSNGFAIRSPGADPVYGRWSQEKAIERYQKQSRSIPKPHPDHPGNVFVQGEEVKVRLPQDIATSALRWQLKDDAGRIIQKGILKPKDSFIKLGQLPVGWYNLEFFSADNNRVGRTTAAVLAGLKAPVPQDSPVCVDSATAWFSKNDPKGQAYLAGLAALAGVNWIRDRLSWHEIEPSPQKFAPADTSYDSSAAVQADYGLKVLQVFHGIPDWAVDKQLDSQNGRGRFPRDLLVLYNFCKHLSRRFKGRVLAWEAWNEANIHMFGGHTIDEMCSFQKAAYLGFKAGDPEVIVGWNAYAGLPTRLHTEGLLENETWPYYDTYNFHSYDWPHSYKKLWDPALQAACGRPIWITESDRGMKYVSPPPWCDLSPGGELQKAELMAQAYACSLYSGIHRHFHFILGHYFESHNGVQFGLLRLDHTPRPAYVALAAVGRFLAGARCLGRRVIPGKPDAHIYAFSARPDGCEQDVLVAWAEKEVDWPQRGKTRISWKLPDVLQVSAVYDYLGRSLGPEIPKVLSSKPIYILLPHECSEKLSLIKPPVSNYRSGQPVPIVLQAQIAQKYAQKYEEKKWSEGYVYAIERDLPFDITICVYNFSDMPVHGSVKVLHVPAGGEIQPCRWEVSVGSMRCKKFTGRLVLGSEWDNTSKEGWIKLAGMFQKTNRPVLAFKVHAK